MNKFIKTSLILFAVASSTMFSKVLADDVNTKPIMLKAEANVANVDMYIKNNFIKTKYASAENRFSQGNVKASYNDFADIVGKTTHDDYVFLSYAMKMAEFGFFDLSDELIKKLDNNLYTQNYIKDIKNYYYPTALVNKKDMIYLADAYASIIYNNLAMETTSELLNSTQIADNDYKNYLIALGFYKSNDLVSALKYIDNAITYNDININYKVLKAKILADSNKSKQALKLVNEIKKTEFLTVDFQNKIKTIEEYVSYKSAKDEPLKDYHLSYFYHLQDKSLLATKVLQSSLMQAKEYAPQIYGLLARIYYENDELLKAQEFSMKAYRENDKNYLANLTLADLAYEERNYEEALKFYKSAKKINKKETIASVGIAKSYLAMNKDKKSKKIFEKLLKKNNYDEELLIGSLKIFPHRVDDYLPKIASVDISNNDIWLGLASVAIKDKNYSMAETYLNNSYYIDENNFKYYYYLSLVLRAKGDFEKSNLSLVKCNLLNSDYASSVKAGQNAYEK